MSFIGDYKLTIYIDEAGNTGSAGIIKNKKKGINFNSQPFFALGMLIIKDDEDAKNMLEMFKRFKEKFSITSEIKGATLSTRERNEEMEYLFNQFFDSIHFKINIYDKRFYISTLLLRTFSDNQIFYEDTVFFYTQASILARQNNTFFEHYCSFVSNPNKESYKQYLSFLSEFDYIEIDNENNLIKNRAEELLKTDIHMESINQLFLFEDGSDDLYDLINLNALFEAITWIKQDNELKNKDILFIHDNIDKIEDIIKKYSFSENLYICFEKSSENVFLQIIDYCTSLFLHFYKNTQQIFTEKKEWLPENEWMLTHYSKLQCILGAENIKYTLPIQDWAMSLCVRDMFSLSMPKCNIIFNPLYEKKQIEITQNLINNSYILPFTQNILRR